MPLSQAMQLEVDSVFTECDGAWDWEDHKSTLKGVVELCGCGGAAHSAPLVALPLLALWLAVV